MTAPSPYDVNATVVVGPWQQRTAPIDQRAVIAAQIATLERRQADRFAALAELRTLIARRQDEIERLRGQL